MKLVFNLVLGLNRAALAEGLAFANACGLDPAEALRVLRSGVAYSRVMETKGPKMVGHDFRPQARLSQHLKDVRLILAEARRAGAAVPLSELHRALLERLEAAGLGDADNAAIIRAFEPPSEADRPPDRNDR
jgi:3-hydroxyisobutyrate dehydrogenase-like beta-hydroxyacid dehydrogenase